LCLWTVSAEVASSSTENATTLALSSASLGCALPNAASWALQYGHYDPR
jgi:hypothetical protein